MIKRILKILFIFTAIVAVGQIPIKKSSLGYVYINGLKTASSWTVDRIRDSKVFAGVPLPKWLENLVSKKKALSQDLSEDFRPLKTEIQNKIEPLVPPVDRERVMRLLE